MGRGFEQLTVLDHPLIEHKMAILRSEETGRKQFRELIREITSLGVYEATRALPVEMCNIKTPLTETQAKRLRGLSPTIIPILRAGLGMVDGVTNLIPTCRIGHLGMYRDKETLQPVPYYAKLPADLDLSPIFLLDPMLATGGSASAAVNFIKEKGGKDIVFMCIVATRQGVQTLVDAHPDVRIYTAAFDEELTPEAHITPGLGDAGDRLFGTL